MDKTHTHYDSFYISDVRISPQTVLAPLAGITCLPFRKMIKSVGCGLVYTEMINARALVYESDKTIRMMELDHSEHPVSVQIFGSEPDIMAEAARIVQDKGADILDINFGCAVRKVLKTGSGAALMQDPQLTEQILKTVRRALDIPLTIKIRSGWDPSGQQAFQISEIAENCGVDAIAFHPRTAQQGFRGYADRSLIKKLKRKSTVPVIGNGDITSPESAISMLNETGCDGVMIGRAAMSEPYIFSETARLLAGKAAEARSIDKHFDLMNIFVNEMVDHHGESVGCTLLRSRLCFLVKGLPGAVNFRKSLSHVKTEKEVTNLIENFRTILRSL